MSSILTGITLKDGAALLTALFNLGASPAIQDAAKQWLVERAGLPQDKLDALIASEHLEPPPKQ